MCWVWCKGSLNASAWLVQARRLCCCPQPTLHCMQGWGRHVEKMRLVPVSVVALLMLALGLWQLHRQG